MQYQHTRRDFLKASGPVTLATGMGLAAIQSGHAAADDAAKLVAETVDGWTEAVKQAVKIRDFLEVRNPKTLPPRLKAQRTLLGIVYKPCVVRTAKGELLVIAFCQVAVEDKIQEPAVLFRSQDDGRTWSEPETLPLLGREPYFSITRDGTLFITSHIHGFDARNQYGRTVNYLHRSTDHGVSWESTPILAWGDLPEGKQGDPPEKAIWISRNVLELRDGTLILGACKDRGRYFLWRSADGGKTWDRSIKCELEGVENISKAGLEAMLFMAETVFFEAPNGDLLAFVRADQKVFPALPGTEAPQESIDHAMRMVVFRSQDGGRRWKLDRPLGSYYGEMYPSVLRLASGKLLLTFTVRRFRPPLGVQAVLGEELKDGFQFDFSSDRIVIDDKTPIGQRSGGGFGPTIQLPDGTLVTAVSFRAPDNLGRPAPHVEVVRWRLPEGT